VCLLEWSTLTFQKFCPLSSVRPVQLSVSKSYLILRRKRYNYVVAIKEKSQTARAGFRTQDFMCVSNSKLSVSGRKGTV
jgi:hypothetical protein